MTKTKRVFIIDGYNVLHRVPALAPFLRTSLETAREALVRFCAEWIATRRDVWRFYVVFDGESYGHGAQLPAALGVQSVYSETGESADRRIAAIVRERSQDCRCVVVSDDNEVVRDAKRQDAEVQSAAAFYGTLDASRRKRGGAGEAAGGKGLSPVQERAINDELRRLWGGKS